MVHLSACFFLSVIFLATHVTSNKCCEGDVHCSGCWMCPGSNLRSCWDSAIEEIEKCSSYHDLSKEIDCLCKAYGKVAHCWSLGRCCTEYSPTLAAATNLCNLNTYPEDVMPQHLVQKAKNDAYYVREAIWTNNSGLNVPKMSVYVKAYSGDESKSSSYSSSKKDNEDDPSQHYTSSYTHYKNKSSATWQSEKSSSEQENNDAPEKKPSQQYGSEKKQFQQYSPVVKSPYKAPTPTKNNKYQPSEGHKYESHTQFTSDEHKKIHHQAKCSREKHKCQAEIANQYHKARRDNTSHTHVKRAQSPLYPRFNTIHKNAELWKRSERLNSKGEPECGIDFHGVQYPTSIPETVSQVFAAL